MSIKRPYIDVHTIDYSRVSTMIDGQIKIAIAIEGSTGTMSTKLISSQAQLLKEYADTQEISPQLPDSMLHALKVLQFSPLYVSRVGSTTVLPGKSVRKGDMQILDTVFTDNEFDPYYITTKVELFENASPIKWIAKTAPSSTGSCPDTVIDAVATETNFLGGSESAATATIYSKGTLPGLKWNTKDVSEGERTVRKFAENDISSEMYRAYVNEADESEGGSVEVSASIQLGRTIYAPAGSVGIMIGNDWQSIESLNIYKCHKTEHASPNSVSYYNDETDSDHDSVEDSSLFVAMLEDRFSKGETQPVCVDAKFDINFGVGDKAIRRIVPVGEDLVAAIKRQKASLVNDDGSIDLGSGTLSFRWDPSFVAKNCGFAIYYGGRDTNDACHRVYVDVGTPDYDGISDGNLTVFDPNNKSVDVYAGVHYSIADCTSFIALMWRLGMICGEGRNFLYVPNGSNVVLGGLSTTPVAVSGKYETNGKCSVFYRATDLPLRDIDFNEDGAFIATSPFEYNGVGKLDTDKIYETTLQSKRAIEDGITVDQEFVKVTKTTTIVSGGEEEVSKEYFYFYNGDENTFMRSLENKTMTDTYVQISSAKMSYTQFMLELTSKIKTVLNSTPLSNGFMLYDKDTQVKYEAAVGTDTSLFDGQPKCKTKDYSKVWDNSAVAFISKCVNKNNVLKVTMTKQEVDPELYDLALTRKTDTENYVIAFKPNKVDGYGMNRYYNYVNDEDGGSEYFYILRLDDDLTRLPPDAVKTPLFGSEVLILESSTTDWQNAANRFREKTGDYYDYIFDAGHANISYANTLQSIGKDLYTQVILTFPDEKGVKNLINYRNALGIDHWETVMRVPRIQDTTLGDFVVDMSPGCDWLQRKIYNKSAGKEFAPIFGITNGAGFLKPKYKYTDEEEQTKLINSQVCPLLWNRAKQTPYYLLDLTAQKADSSLSDANNVHMVNLIAHMCDEICEYYIGRFNDEATRGELVRELTNAFNDRLIRGQMYQINAFKIICDETNNPNEIIDQRRLIVDIKSQFRPGIRYIDVYHGIYSLSTTI